MSSIGSHSKRQVNQNSKWTDTITTSPPNNLDQQNEEKYVRSQSNPTPDFLFDLVQ